MPDERRLVTVMFADVVGSTRLGDELDPEDLRTLLGRFYAIAREIVASRDGTVEKFIGDAVMAIFGLPTAHGDDAERALDAALELRDRVATDPALGEQLPIRIGVNTGEVVANSDRAASDFLITGDAVNLAARLQQSADPWRIVCSDRTARATRGRFAFGPRIAVDARGKSTPVATHELIGHSTGHVTARPPLIGREADLAQLELIAHRAFSERRPYLVSVIAPAGAGKTRLLQGFLEVLASSDPQPRIVIAQCVPYGERLTYWPLRALLAGISGLDIDAHSDGLRDALASWLADAGDPDAPHTAEQLAATLGTTELEVVDQHLVFAAWRRAVELSAVRRPLVLVVEDLHWSSDSLLDLVESIFAPRSDVPVLMVALSRPELLDRRPGWGGGRRNYVSVALEPLSGGDIARLVSTLLEDPAPAVVDAVVARADGNPFYAGELVRSLIELGTDLHDPGIVATAVARLPDTVQATILARLDGLPPLGRRLLQLGSVMGRSFDPSAIRALGSMPLDRLDQALQMLAERELVVATSPGRYDFHHILIREVAYGTLARSDRALLHAAAGRHLEAAAGESDELAELVAFHFREAVTLSGASGGSAPELRERAVLWLRRAAEAAYGGGATIEAARHLHAAIELAREAELPDLHRRLGEVSWTGNETAAAFGDAYRHGVALGRSPAFLLQVLASRLMVLARWHASVSLQPTEEVFQEMRADAQRLFDVVDEERARATFLIAESFVPFWIRSSGRRLPSDAEVGLARQRAEAGLAVAKRLGDPQLESAALDGLSSFVVEDDPSAAREIQRRRTRLADRLDVLERSDAFQMVAWQSALLGDVEGALEASVAGLATILPGQAPERVMVIVSWQAWALALSGRWPELRPVVGTLRQMWVEGGRPSAAYVLHGLLAASAVAAATRDDALLERCREMVDEICGRFPLDHPARDLAAVARFELDRVATRVVGGYERYIERLHLVALAIAVCADRGYRLPRPALDAVIRHTAPRQMRWIEAEARRAHALEDGDVDELERAVVLLRPTGAGPRIARAEADLAWLSKDERLYREAVARLERLGDTDAASRSVVRG